MSDSIPPLKVIFAGTPDFAAYHLKALVESASCDIVAVYTQPDRPAGRGKKLSSSPVKKLAEEVALPVYQPESLKNHDAQHQLKALEADVMIVVAYGLLLPQAVLDIPRFGCLNVHGSLLPRWRGAAPIQRAIAAGDKLTGITIMQMDKGLDTGDMLHKLECPITEDDTSASLHDKLMTLGALALKETIALLITNQLRPESQNDNDATYAEKITKPEALINWIEPASIIHTKIRAYNPFPVAYTFLNQSRIKIYQADIIIDKSIKPVAPGTIVRASIEGVLVSCLENFILIKECQLPNKKSMLVADIINGNSQIFNEGTSFEINNLE